MQFCTENGVYSSFDFIFRMNVESFHLVFYPLGITVAKKVNQFLLRMEIICEKKTDSNY